MSLDGLQQTYSKLLSGRRKFTDRGNDFFFPLRQVCHAASKWYGEVTTDSCCLAECRLARGERPYRNKE